MGISLRHFYHEAGQRAATVTQIKATLAAAGWAAVTSDGYSLYRSALPGVNGNYAYVYLTDDDGSSRIGITVGASLGDDVTGLSLTGGGSLGQRSTPDTSAYVSVWASERWFLLFSDDYDEEFPFLGGGLYFPYFAAAGAETLIVFGNQAFNSATTYFGSLFDTSTGMLAATTFNAWHGSQLASGAYINVGAGADFAVPGAFGPIGSPYSPATIMRITAPTGFVGMLYDAYQSVYHPDRILGEDADTKSFVFNGWTYFSPQSTASEGESIFHAQDVGGGPLFLRLSEVS